MKKCSKCGAEMPDNEKFCMRCGNNLSTANNNTPNQTPATPSHPAPKKKSKVWIWILVVIGIIAVIGTGIIDLGYYAYKQITNEDSATSDATVEIT